MSATDIHCPDFARRLTAALLDLKRAEAAWESAAAAAIENQTDAMAARRLAVATGKLGERQRNWDMVLEVVTTSVRLETELAAQETR